MGKRRKDNCVESARDNCKNDGMFGNIICLIIVLIVLEFLCSLLGEEECVC
jgi:t-SNARE complex subunit (syntaxin)